MTSRKRVGLALGGGVVRGNAHIGVLAALEAAGVQVDMISGTSVGAIIAAASCAGMNAEQIRTLSKRFNWWRLLRPTWPWRGLVTMNGLGHLLQQQFGDLCFEDLKRPCAICVTDLIGCEVLYVHSGPVIPIVMASCSVPGLVAPVAWEGRLLGEGGISDMLPARILRQMGADYIIGVDIFQPYLYRWLGPLGFLIAGLETALENSGGGKAQVDCLISPKLGGSSYMHFSHRSTYYELGRQATLASLPTILHALDMD